MSERERIIKNYFQAWISNNYKILDVNMMEKLVSLMGYHLLNLMKMIIL